jgi:tetratricopeptide (TPR) repeat protein
MKHRLIATVATLVVISFSTVIGTVPISAQETTPTPGAPVPASITDLERRTYQLEVTQAQTIRALEINDKHNKDIITGIGAFIAVLVAVQGIATGIQLHREGKRDRTEGTSIEEMTHVMNVVQQTLQSRLDAEKQAREETAEAQHQLQKFENQVKSLEQFYQNFQKNIRSLREEIEKRATELAQISRHDFRRKTDELNSFAQQVNMFKTQFKALEEESRTFSAAASYVRGIAAHYANQPEGTKVHLQNFVDSQPPKSDEDKRHVATAYYYLGLTECNFGNHENAISLFEKANKLDLQLDIHKRDFLTPLVTAEAHVMMDSLDMARQFTNETKTGLRTIEQKRPLRNSEQRVRSRAILIEANMVILGHEADWHGKAQQLLEQVHAEDPYYYYATATLAQVYYDQDRTDEAQELFREAYTTIERSGHLLTVTEARSRILLLMTAGTCCKHGLTDEKRAEQHLDEADHLRDSLPRMGSQVCTVFSTLSKRNESSDTIRRHIELIRQGKVLL